VQPLQHSIGVNGRQPECVTQLLLRQRQVKTILHNKPNVAQAQVHLTDQMSDALAGISSSDVDDPGAQHRLVYKCAPP
jgi:hypothetical protein